MQDVVYGLNTLCAYILMRTSASERRLVVKHTFLLSLCKEALPCCQCKEVCEAKKERMWKLYPVPRQKEIYTMLRQLFHDTRLLIKSTVRHKRRKISVLKTWKSFSFALLKWAFLCLGRRIQQDCAKEANFYDFPKIEFLFASIKWFLFFSISTGS